MGDGVVAPRGWLSGPAAGCLGCRMSKDWAGCPGAWIMDELEEPLGQKGNSGKNSDELVDGNCGREGEKLDELEAKQIRGSNPTKLHHTNKSQKKLGLFLVGIFGFRKKTTKSS